MRAEANISTKPSAKILPPRFAPLRSLPDGSMFRGTCTDCSLEEEHQVSTLIEEGRMGGMTAEMIGKTFTCKRMGCGCTLVGDIDLPY